ncbi:MAG: aa3-type cytochrome c oxidase subunit IV [Pseudomonadota bacterium]
MADDKHEHGKMDIEVQEKVFEGFIKWVVYGTVVILVVLIILALFRT